MTNPLLTPAEQAHVDAVRLYNEQRLQAADAGFYNEPEHTRHHYPSNAWEALLDWLARVDWYKVFIWAARLTVVGFIGYAGYKLVLVWQSFPGWQLLAFLDMHTPLMLFSGLFVFFFLHHKDSEHMGVIALLSTVLNALLV